MADYADDEATISKPESEVCEDGGGSTDIKYMTRLGDAMQILSGVDMDLAYSSEKLVNLHILLTHTLAWDDFEEMEATGECLPDENLEKALVFDLLAGLLEGEVVELYNNMSPLQARLFDVKEKLNSSKEWDGMSRVLEEKLRDSEESRQQFREKISEMKTLSAKLQRSLLAFQHRNSKIDDGLDFPESPIIGNPLLQTVDQQRHTLRMLKKSLARELDLERKFLEAKENEEELRVKLHYSEQVVSHIEEISEAAWLRFLEADNAATVLLGTSKECLNRLQIVQFNLNGSMRRENELKGKLQDCLDQLKVKDEIIQKLQTQAISSETGISSKQLEGNSEMMALRSKVESLEQKLKESEERLKTTTTFSEAHGEKPGEEENLVKSLKETIAVAEIRAESAEAKLNILNETNLELTEEITFLKSNDPNVEKVTVLEEQLRDLEIRLQHAKASAEASQEQQNMLYSAIWDMETLIEDLKSKVSKSESKVESTEEQCLLLSESNFELNKEVDFLRDRIEFLESSVEEASSEKLAIFTDINIRSKLISELVTRITFERERVQKQLSALAEENKALAQKLRSRNKGSLVTGILVNGNIKDTLLEGVVI